MKITTVRRVGLAFALAVAVAAAAGAVAPGVAQAQQVMCNPGTGAFYRAVGPQNAPMLVPMQVPLTICSAGGTVVGVMPAFRTIGPATAPLIIPTPLPVRTCAPTVVAATPVVGGGVMPALQFVQVGSGVIVVSGITPSSPTVLTTAPAAFTCF